MPRMQHILSAAALLAGAVACGDSGTGPGDSTRFGAVQAVLSDAACRNCHNGNNSVYHGALNLTTDRAADSAAVQNFLNFETPEQSPLIQRPLLGSSLTHPVRPFDATSDEAVQTIVRYATALAEAGASRTLTAARATAAPTVDGVAEAAWNGATALLIPISGGFAGDVTVTMRALYTTDRIYFLLEWDDPTESVVRSPWVKTASGWLKQSVAPLTFDNSRLASWRNPPEAYYYEDKLAIIWNTVGASAVDGFDENGCAVLCHVDRPGDPRPLKYTNSVGETADMWHWKLVRTNAVHRLDDQYVYWNRAVSVNSGGGRAGDPGGGEYSSNGSVLPAFMSANQPAPPFHLVDSATAAQWAAAGVTVAAGDIARPFVDDFAVGDMIANAITTLKPNVDRSNIEAYGVWAAGRWTLEISRALQTSSLGTTPPGGSSVVPVDVQFTAGQEYRFGVAVFENAQIEHSWSPGVFSLRFQQ
ncbi:MAG: hypothetical protein HY705_04840 [Gemmatimonadetes bacterium]|nr:hypothetical protein [Gemmatimonadota bacterium]